MCNNSSYECVSWGRSCNLCKIIGVSLKVYCSIALLCYYSITLLLLRIKYLPTVHYSAGIQHKNAVQVPHTSIRGHYLYYTVIVICVCV